MRSTPRFAAAVMLIALVGLTLSILIRRRRAALDRSGHCREHSARAGSVALHKGRQGCGTVNALQSGPWTVRRLESPCSAACRWDDLQCEQLAGRADLHR